MQKRYQEKNHQDFVFKSSYIARDLDISNQQVGHMLSQLEKDGFITRNESKKTTPYRWQTQFNVTVPVKRKSFWGMFRKK